MDIAFCCTFEEHTINYVGSGVYIYLIFFFSEKSGVYMHALLYKQKIYSIFVSQNEIHV